VNSAADSSAINDATAFILHRFPRRDNDFILRFDNDFSSRLSDRLSDFNCALATNTSGMTGTFRAFDGYGTGSSKRHQHGSSDGHQKRLHFPSPIDWVVGG